MHKIVSIVKRPLIAELSLLLHEMGLEYHGLVLSDNGNCSDNVEVVPTNYGFSQALKTASLAFFPECDDDLALHVHNATRSSVPVVMFANCKVIPIEHDKTGMLYINCAWATRWIRELCTNLELRERITIEALKLEI